MAKLTGTKEAHINVPGFLLVLGGPEPCWVGARMVQETVFNCLGRSVSSSQICTSLDLALREVNKMMRVKEQARRESLSTVSSNTRTKGVYMELTGGRSGKSEQCGTSNKL